MYLSLKDTSICVVDDRGAIVSETTVMSELEAGPRFLAILAPGAVRIGDERGLDRKMALARAACSWPAVICIDARHAKAGLPMEIKKSGRNDAVGLARTMQAG